MRLFLILSAFILSSYGGNAAIKLTILKEIKLHARLLTVDRTGNIYVVTTSNELIRYNAKGDSTASFQNKSNGMLQFVDVSNPLKPVLYYPTFSKLLVLDRMLSPQNEINLRDADLQNATAIAGSIDGKFWVYDPFQARLKKLDEQMNVAVQSNDLRQDLGTVPKISFIAEADWKVLLCDSTKGIHMFDFQGNYINTLSIYTNKIQVFGAQLIYVQNDTLYSWDKFKLNQPLMPLPRRNTKILDALIHERDLLVLYEDRIVFYKVQEEK